MGEVEMSETKTSPGARHVPGSDEAREVVAREFEEERTRAYKRGKTTDIYTPPSDHKYFDKDDDDDVVNW